MCQVIVFERWTWKCHESTFCKRKCEPQLVSFPGFFGDSFAKSVEVGLGNSGTFSVFQCAFHPLPVQTRLHV